MKKYLRWHIIASCILHMLVASLIFLYHPLMMPTKKGQSNNSQNAPQIHEKILPKPAEKMEVTVVDGPAKKVAVKEKVKKSPKCKYWYGGIGLTHDVFGTILEVVPGYPAHKAGMLPGDELLDGPKADLRGDPGTKVTFLVRRNGQILGFSMIRDKICYDGT
jgi:hypothetical protein